ncbi:MAG: 50S ribosomal protein L15, partial [Armatimonadetes bacterium]|nr:50S ribosomal protein L15 [Armatimonadota bacterium]
RNRFARVYATVNLGELAVFPAGSEVTPELLVERKIVREIRDGVKVLGSGELSHGLTVKAHQFSASARARLEAVGGSAEVIGG